MRKFNFAVIIMALAGWAGAQQVKLLEAAPAPGPEKTVSVPVKEAAQIILPSEDKPAPVVKPAAAKAPAAPAPAAKKAPAVKKKAAPPTPAPAPEPKPEGGFVVTKTHTVTKGDTLWDLSVKYYRDPFKWGRIYNANLSVVSNPDLIVPKEELVIPEITEEVKPGPKKTFVIGEGETVKDAEFSSAEVSQPEGGSPAQARPVKSAGAELGELPGAFDRNDLSEDMPEHQKEWTVLVVADNWREDGVITAKEKGDNDSMDDSLSESGETVTVSMDRSGLVKPGDHLAVYLKGADAYGKDGKKLGREIQPAGTLRVLSADGSDVRARVVDSVTSISKGYVVKKR